MYEFTSVVINGEATGEDLRDSGGEIGKFGGVVVVVVVAVDIDFKFRLL